MSWIHPVLLLLLTGNVLNMSRASISLSWCWVVVATQSETLPGAGESSILFLLCGSLGTLKKLERWSLRPTWLAQPPLLAGCRTYETSLLVEEAISEELPYSGKVYLMVPPPHSHQFPE